MVKDGGVVFEPQHGKVKTSSHSPADSKLSRHSQVLNTIGCTEKHLLLYILICPAAAPVSIVGGHGKRDQLQVLLRVRPQTKAVRDAGGPVLEAAAHVAGQAQSHLDHVGTALRLRHGRNGT